MGPNLEQLAAEVATLRTQLSRLTVPENGRPPTYRLARVTGEPDPDLDGIETAEEPSDGVRWKVRFVDVLFPVDGDEDIAGPTLVERSSTDQLAAATRGLGVDVGNLVGCVLAADGTWWIATVFPTAAEANTDTCCGCSPTVCTYDGPLVSSQWGEIPPTLEFDAGDVLCCYGNAGGVHRLAWTGSVWRSNVFACEADGGGEPSCGTALYTAITTGDCVDTSETIKYRCGFYTSGGSTQFGWYVESACPACYEDPAGGSINCEPDDCDSIADNGKTCFLPCTYVGDSASLTWQLTTNNCTCDEQPSPPGTDPTFEGETSTVTCPGTPDENEAPAVPCDEDGNIVEGVLFGPGVLADAQASGYWQLSGTVIWVGAFGYNNQHSMSGDFCDTEGVGWLTDPTDETGTWVGIQNDPQLYTIMACPASKCPPEGSVLARWVLSPGAGYEAARLELIVAGVVKIRYMMPAGRLFCAKCQNLMTVEQDDCEWPCAGIAEKVCVHPHGGALGASCEDFENSYSFEIGSTDDETNPNMWECSNQSLAEAAGSWVLDLIDSEPWMPRKAENGCRAGDPAACCTWVTPALTPITGGGCLGDCVVLRGAYWTMQTCNPRVQSLGRNQGFQHYDCFEKNLASPILRLALCDVFNDGRGIFGPSIVDYRTMYWDDGCKDIGPGDVPQSFSEVSDNINNVDYTYSIFAWRFQEKRSDGALVMINDSILSDVPGYLPRTIILTPAV